VKKNLKMEDKSREIYLNNIDFDFIEYYLNKYNIARGNGDAIRLSIILNEYKKFMKDESTRRKDIKNSNKE